MKHLRLSALVPALLVAPLAAQAVITVDDDGPADFSDLNLAVTSAPDGATVLVRDGFYNGAGDVVIQAKSLVVTADAGASVRMVNGTFVVRDLAPDQRVVLRGLTIAPAPLGFGLQAQDCQGAVWVESVTFEGTAFVLVPPLDMVTVRDCEAVVVARSSVVGSSASYPGGGGAGIHALRSRLHLYQTAVLGGGGGSSGTNADPGGPGIRLEESFLFAGASSVIGGPGGAAGTIFGCSGATSGAGGTGLVLGGASSDAHLVGTSLAGGPPGTVTGTCTPGAGGAASQVLAGNQAQTVWPDHGFSVSGPVSQSAGATMRFTGPPGEFAWYLYSEDATTLFLPTVLGTLTLDLPFFIVPVGTLDAEGRAFAPVSAAVPPGAENVVFLLQALFLDTTANQFTLASPASLVVLANGI